MRRTQTKQRRTSNLVASLAFCATPGQVALSKQLQHRLQHGPRHAVTTQAEVQRHNFEPLHKLTGS
jgi:coenzyme F420-reducing hydrogenase gamma subunit